MYSSCLRLSYVDASYMYRVLIEYCISSSNTLYPLSHFYACQAVHYMNIILIHTLIFTHYTAGARHDLMSQKEGILCIRSQCANQIKCMKGHTEFGDLTVYICGSALIARLRYIVHIPQKGIKRNLDALIVMLKKNKLLY